MGGRVSTDRRALLVGIGVAAAGAATVFASIVLTRQPAPDAASRQITAAAATVGADGLLPAPTLGADGMWIEAWERPTTGDLSRDAALAAAEGKLLVVIWEREGCPYCLQLHTHDYRIPALHAYMADKFYVVRLDFYGGHTIRDFDGTTVSEHEIAGRHRTVGTPTLEFYNADRKEVLRIPGYVEPDILQAAFEFADTGAYRQSNINTWLRERNLL